MVINYSKYFIGLLGKLNEFSLQSTSNSAKHIVSIITSIRVCEKKVGAAQSWPFEEPSMAFSPDSCLAIKILDLDLSI